MAVLKIQPEVHSAFLSICDNPKDKKAVVRVFLFPFFYLCISFNTSSPSPPGTRQKSEKSVVASTRACTSISRTKAPAGSLHHLLHWKVSTLLLLLPPRRLVCLVPADLPVRTHAAPLGITRSAAAVCSRGNCDSCRGGRRPEKPTVCVHSAGRDGWPLGRQRSCSFCARPEPDSAGAAKPSSSISAG